MKIKLNAQVSDKPTPVISLNGLVLTIDGTDIDLSVIPEGGQAESDNDLLSGIITRDKVTINYPYSTDIYEPMQSTDPLDYEFDIIEGVVPCPLVKRPITEQEAIKNV